MAILKSTLGSLAVMAAAVHAALDTSSAEEMGPNAFMWPTDRVWSASMDNTAPCGSVASPGNRSDFPMQNGRVALVGQNESFSIELSVSYLSNPKSNSDFTTLIDDEDFKSMDLGHVCVPLPDAPSSVSAGDNATLQIKYISAFDKPDNETFYACADITYIELADFDESIPCFNATRPAEDDDKDNHGTSSSSSSENDKGSSRLSGGAIAGIVIGSVAGVALIALAALMLYRRRSQKEATMRQQQSARGVDWAERPPKGSHSTHSVRMDDLAPRGA